MNNIEQANPISVIDTEALENRFQGRKDFINRLLNLALNENGNAPEQLETIIKQRDYDELRAFSHTMKGMAANIMAHQLRNTAQNIEKKARNQDEDVFTAAEDLKIELVKFLKELENLLQN